VSEPATGQLDVRAVLERWGAIEEGHFELTSGRHSNRYVQKARVLERPEVAMELAREVASWYPVIDVVVSPAVGAIPFGFAVALAADARSIFAERVHGAMALRRGFVLEAGERALVVEDVVTTGGSAREVVELVHGSGAEPLGVAALVDRAATALPFPLRALVRVEAVAWARDECPLCRAGVALDTPGSRHL
jgi:orotate phosphoribosyltransferase